MKHFLRLCLLLSFLVFQSGPPVHAADTKQYILDAAGLLTAPQVSDLKKSISDFRRTYGLDLVLATTSNTRGKTTRAYADDLYDTHGFGTGTDKSGLLILIDMQNRRNHISTTGKAIRIFTDARIERLLDAQAPALKQANYYRAFISAIMTAEGMLKQDIEAASRTSARARPTSATTTRPVAASSSASKDLSFMGRLALAAFLGLFPAIIIAYTLFYFVAPSTPSVPFRPPVVPRCRFKLTQEDDLFMDRRVSTRTIHYSDDTYYTSSPSSSSWSSSGSSSSSYSGSSSSYTSSSGQTHGGGGRSF